jgi:hypothetical protein
MKRIVGVGIILATGAALVLGNFALASGASPSPAGERNTTTLELVLRPVQEQFIDQGDSGDTPGDQFIFSDDIFQGGRRIGQNHGFCVWTRVVPEGAALRISTACQSILALPRGQLTLQVSDSFLSGEFPPPHFTAITGGTEAYKAARGQVHVRTISATEFRYTVRVIF